MSLGIKRPTALAMLAAVCGCASLKPATAKPDYFVPAGTTPSIRITHEPAAVPLNEFYLQPLIVPAERVAAVGGSELLAQARAEFVARREARIASAGGQPLSEKMANANVSGGDVAEGALRFGFECLRVGFVCPLAIVALPVVIPIAFAAASAHDAGKRAIRRSKAAGREAQLVIPESEATRLLGMIEARASTAALAERAAAHALPANSADAQARTWLVVSLESIDVDTLQHRRVAMRITAQAQAITATGAMLAPTRHVYEWIYWSSPQWTAEDSARVEGALDPALEALAQGIAFAYTPSFNLEEQVEEPDEARAQVAALFPPPMPRPPEPASSFPTVPLVRALPLPDSAFPQRGDTWTYRLSVPGKSIDRVQRITVLSAVTDEIEEQIATDGHPVVRTRHAKGSHLSRESGVLAFSPYLAAFGSVEKSLHEVRIDSRDGCSMEWVCSVSVSVLGNEVVRVLDAEVEATKVEVLQTWMPRVQYGQSGRQTLTLWYAPEVKRVVKVSSRGPRDALVETNFDLELQGFQLN